MIESDEEIEQHRKAVIEADLKLQETIARLCPGPHVLTQHRDGNNAWCESCRRTRSGLYIKEK